MSEMGYVDPRITKASLVSISPMTVVNRTRTQPLAVLAPSYPPRPLSNSTCRRSIACERLASQRTGIINQIRAFLLERGIAVQQGLRFLRIELPRILATPSDVLSPRCAGDRGPGRRLAPAR
jgi:hypothetical protein